MKPNHSSPASGAVNPQPVALANNSAVPSLHQYTPARIFVGRSGSAYRTQTQLELREDHAAARDAVHRELNPRQDFGTQFVERWPLTELETLAVDKREFLIRPDLGRRLSLASATRLAETCPRGADLQICIGDGLSASAAMVQVPRLLPLLIDGTLERGWSLGSFCFIRHCRVGIMNHVGEILVPRVVVLLIGERPGLRTAESLSAYMAYRPRAGDTDAQRNLVSNIHSRGIEPAWAARRILALAEEMVRQGRSGVQVKESLTQGIGPTSARRGISDDNVSREKTALEEVDGADSGLLP